ncbi:hypothetical protein BHQ20_08455 [Mycobacterium intermedium]|nr:hypothetical protein BHQ20_08455 [Mycobacterium intermedium]
MLDRQVDAPAVAGAELLALSVELDDVLSLELALDPDPESLFEDALVDPFDFLPASRLSVR